MSQLYFGQAKGPCASWGVTGARGCYLHMSCFSARYPLGWRAVWGVCSGVKGSSSVTAHDRACWWAYFGASKVQVGSNFPSFSQQKKKADLRHGIGQVLLGHWNVNQWLCSALNRNKTFIYFLDSYYNCNCGSIKMLYIYMYIYRKLVPFPPLFKAA